MDSLNIASSRQSPRALVVSGPLGAGKTTALRLLLQTCKSRLGEVGLIINDIGATNTDAERLSTSNLVALSDGCVCCDDLSSLTEAIEEMHQKVDTLIIEPTGIADPHAIKGFLQKLGMEHRVLTLLPEKHLGLLLADTHLRPMVEEQVAAADVIGMTKRIPDFSELRAELLRLNVHDVPVYSIPYAPEFSGEALGNADAITQHMQSFWQVLFHSPHLPMNMCSHHHCTEHDHHNHHHEAKNKMDVHHALTQEELGELLRSDSHIWRSKGVVTTKEGHREYDYAFGDLKIGRATTLAPYMTVIAAPGFDWSLIEQVSLGEVRQEGKVEHRSALEKSGTPLETYAQMDATKLMQNAFRRTQVLIDQYNSYMAMEEEKTDLASSELTEESSLRIQYLEAAMRDLGDAMTFEDPIIWMQYKHRAYAGSKKALRTLADLRQHCFERPDYICGKRLRFLASVLEGEFPPETPLEDFYTSEEVQRVTLHPNFSTQWQQNEFYEVNGRVSKWQNIA